jgi:sortase A
VKKILVRKNKQPKSRVIHHPALSQKSTLARRIFSVIGPVGYVFAVLILFHFFSIRIVLAFYERASSQVLAQEVVSVSAQVPKINEVPDVGAPVRIKIPSIQVNAVIREVGKTPSGAMGVPELPRDTAWYKLGPKPGENGSAVIAGHVDWWYGVTGVFKNLKKLKPGDRILVEDDQGTSYAFIVRKSHTYGLKDDTTEVFRSSDRTAYLNLVTCAGVWDRVFKMYSKRLVVFAEKVDE